MRKIRDTWTSTKREDGTREDLKIFRSSVALALRQEDEGVTVGEICREQAISEQTYARWRKKYEGRLLSKLKRLRQLEEDNQ